MRDDEVDEFVERAKRILPRWQREIDQASGEAKEDAQAARDSVFGTLMDIAEVFPEKRPTIDALAKLFGYGTHQATK